MRSLYLLLTLLITDMAMALAPEQVVKSSLQHFPLVIESMQELEVQKNTLKNKWGSFDGKIKAEAKTRTSGYYNGDLYKLQVEKPLPYFNSKIYGGHRQSYGDFPVYEGNYQTLGQGENFAGVSVSLLRNSLIGMNRYNIRMQKQALQQAEVNLTNIKLNVQTMALKAYWTWFTKGHELKVYKNILQLAESRIEKINRRVKVGDLAKIYSVENQQYILDRQSMVAKAELEFQQACYYLSLFHRSEQGQPQSITLSDLPDLKNETLQGPNNPMAIESRALESNLDLKILESKKQQARLDVKMGFNDLLPKLDVKYEWSHDRGAGPSNLAQEDNKIMLNLEIPFQYRQGLGKKRAGQAKVEQVKVKQQWTKDKLRVDVKTLITKLNAYANIFNISSKQVKISEKMAEAERTKFARGASDLILVNIREEYLAQVQIKNLAAYLQYHFIDADLKNIQVHLLQEI